MDLKELLEHFNNGDTLGEDFEVIELMRYYSRQAQKITMKIRRKSLIQKKIKILYLYMINRYYH